MKAQQGVFQKLLVAHCRGGQDASVNHVYFGINRGSMNKHSSVEGKSFDIIILST
jgi:hypothetical protein